MVTENSMRQMLRLHTRVVRAGPHGQFEYTLQGPRGAFFVGQIFDGGLDGVPGQGQRLSNFTFTFSIDAGSPVDTDFTSIASDRTPTPAIVAVEAGGSTPTGIAHWESQTVDPLGATIAKAGVFDMKFTVSGSTLTLFARNLDPRTPFVDYSIRALFFNAPDGVDLSLVSVFADASLPFTFPAPSDKTSDWNLVQAL